MSLMLSVHFQSINQPIYRELLEWSKYINHCWVHYRQCVDTKMSNEPIAIISLQHL